MEGFFDHTAGSLSSALRGAIGGDHILSELYAIPWDAYKSNPLWVLLRHSDCDGEIAPEHCGHIADKLEELLPCLPSAPDRGHIGDWRETTERFIAGLRAAAAANEPLYFH
jgi:hypothetical protein